MQNCFVSWSGGKDALFALYKELKKSPSLSPILLNMCDADENQSRSHGISAQMLRHQAKALNFPIHQAFVDERGYEVVLKEAITLLKNEHAVTHGIFGDIYLWEHRTWIERVCTDMDITPLFPLWDLDTTTLITEFIALGFKTIVLATQEDKLNQSFLGRTIDYQFVQELPTEVDPCGELGEYHTFVYDGPLFQKPVTFTLGEDRYDDKHHRITLIPNLA